MIKIIIDNVFCQIADIDNVDIIKHLDSILSYWVLGHEYTKAFRKGWWDNKAGKWNRWDGKRHLLTDKLKFHTGLLNKVKIILKNEGVAFEEIDNRKQILFNDPIVIQNIEIREYQTRVLEVALREKGGIIQAATGSGKSVMIAQLIANMNVKTMIYVTGIDLLYQMHEMFEKVLKMKIGIIGDGQADVKRINICTVWTASAVLGKKYVPMDDEDYSRKEDVKSINKNRIVKAIKEAELAIFDECHMLATDTLQLINNTSCSARYKYGFSGTPWRDDNADLLLESVCGKTIIEITASELIKDNYLVAPTIYFVDVPKKDNISDQYQSIYKEYIVENEVRNDKIIKSAIKLVDAGRKVLILVKNIKHGDILLEQLEDKYVTYFAKGDVESSERNRIRKDFIKGDIQIIIASVIFDQGIDLPILDALILAGSGKSSGRALQRLGRVIRPFPNKKDAIVVDFIDNAKYLLNHTAERIKIYRTESGFKIKLPERPKEKEIPKKSTKSKKIATDSSSW
ncbi:MAG: DEAD/DEAH box helicase [Patescibacteria group bacterium]